ncbi:MAG: class I SAM-dependent DNA methyltransferase [Candidatus Dormibacteria bacterium]
MSVALSYFEQLYAEDQDPWRLGERWYEQRKRDLSVASLPLPRYRSCFELGCANGDLTSQLAARCARLLAVDAIAAPLERARRRLAGHPLARVELRRLPSEWPEERFDLIVASEFLYYFSAAELARLITQLKLSLEPGATLLAVHWRHPVAEYPLSGDAVHQALRAEPGLALLAEHREEDFLLDVLVRHDPGSPPQSVARATKVPGARLRQGAAG